MDHGQHGPVQRGRPGATGAHHALLPGQRVKRRIAHNHDHPRVHQRDMAFDEWAHHGDYRSYLDAANQVDKWIQEIWNFVQNDPQYKNKTTLFITVDHGRGDKIKSQWRDHGADIEGASQIWFAAMGPEIAPKGEIKTDSQFYQKQFAQTIAKILGYNFTTNHPVDSEVKEIFEK